MARGGHLTPNLCQTSKNASECARPHALQRGAVRVRQAPRSAARRMLPQGAAASEPSLRNPRNTRASGRATSWRSRPVAPLATPARSPDDAGTSGAGGGVACSPCSESSSVGMLRSRGHRVQARLGCCTRNRAPRRDKRCAAVPVGLWSDHPTRLRSGAVWVAVLRRGSLTGLPARNQAPWGC